MFPLIATPFVVMAGVLENECELLMRAVPDVIRPVNVPLVPLTPPAIVRSPLVFTDNFAPVFKSVPPVDSTNLSLRLLSIPIIHLRVPVSRKLRAASPAPSCSMVILAAPEVV